MKCLICNQKMRVLETRSVLDNLTRRRYVCVANNNHRFTTHETIVRYDDAPISKGRKQLQAGVE